MFESYLPQRAIEDVLAGRLPVVLGGEVYHLPVRSIASNRRWVESLTVEMSEMLRAIAASGDDQTALATALMRVGAEQLLDLVLAYDDTEVLPPKEALEEEVKPHEVLAAVIAIRRVQNPLADAGLAAAANAIAGTSSQEPTSLRQKNGASRRPKRSRKG